MKKELLEMYIIRPALDYLDMDSDAAVNLLLGTCAQESLMGRYVSQIGGGPGIGIYQIEPNTHKDIFYNYLNYRDDLRRKIMQWRIGDSMHDTLRHSIFYQTLIARLIYRRCPEKLPSAEDVKGLAQYWKDYYNTVKGKGKTDDFIRNYLKYVRTS